MKAASPHDPANPAPLEVLADCAASMANDKTKDNWTSESYQKAAAFVPELATKIVEWLDIQPDDVILDIGCGDGVLTQRIAERLTTGFISGIDSSASMIATASSRENAKLASKHQLPYKVLDAAKILENMPTGQAAADPPQQLDNGSNILLPGTYSKVFSNAALHWILRQPASREGIFHGVFKLLRPGGKFVFEMGGHGNVAELRAALISAVASRRGIRAARNADPWFFPDEKWMHAMLEKTGFVVTRSELEYRPTKAETGDGGGVEGWVRLMGKTFLDTVGEEEREDVVKEVCQTLETVCGTEQGEQYMGYVRLRVIATKPE